jgi:uncharacterized protein (TIGR02594 family)
MNYDYLRLETSPQILVKALELLGTKEIVGSIHSNIIMSWAKDLGIEKIYTADEIAWCGLFMSIVCKRANVDAGISPKDALWALNWNKFGTKQTKAMLGDVLTFKRNGGGHVGVYVGEDATCYHVLGGNQSNMVCITRIEKSRCAGIRRTPWKMSQPNNVRAIALNSGGLISKNEA